MKSLNIINLTESIIAEMAIRSFKNRLLPVLLTILKKEHQLTNADVIEIEFIIVQNLNLNMSVMLIDVISEIPYDCNDYQNKIIGNFRKWIIDRVDTIINDLKI